MSVLRRSCCPEVKEVAECPGIVRSTLPLEDPTRVVSRGKPVCSVANSVSGVSSAPFSRLARKALFAPRSARVNGKPPPMTILDKVPTVSDSHIMTLADGRDLGWLELGAADGWPVFGFHGTPGSRLQLTFDEDAVRRAGVRLVALDRPGYGLSTYQPARRLTDWPQDVAELADHLGVDRFSVMGISGGGPHAAVCAAMLGERVASAGIVSGVGPMTNPESSDGMTRSNRLLVSLAHRHSKILSAIFEVQAHFAKNWPGKALDLVIKELPPADADILRRPDVRAIFERDVRRSSRTTGRAQAQDFVLFASEWGFDLTSIRVPVVLWQGDADRNVPLHHAQVMHDAISNSVLHTFAGEGHFLVINRLEEILVGLSA